MKWFSNNLPENWRTRKLKRVTTLRYGDSLAVDSREDGEISVYGSNGIVGSHNVTNQMAPGLIVGRKGSCGKISYTTDPAFVIDTAYGIDGRCSRNNLRWLYYSLSSSTIDQKMRDSPVPGLACRDAYAIDFPLPPLPEQKRIAAYLDVSCAAIDRAVETKRKQLETLDALRKSIIQRIVTQGLNPKVKMKIVPMDGVGMVPNHWRVKQLRYICQISYGITLQLEVGKTDGVPILTVQNLDIHGNWKFDQEFCIDEDLVHEDDFLRHGDLLFNWRNGSARHVGKTAFFDLDGRYTHVSFLLRMRCSKHLSPFYLKSYLGALRMAGFFEGSKDKVNKTFNSTELNRLSVLVPPIEEQKEIVTVVQEKWEEIENLRNVIEDQISTLTAYRKSLIHECVTGKRRISDADIAEVAAHV